MSDVSRRSVLKAATSVMTLSMLSASARAALAQETWDVIVVGGGTAGMPIAIFAAGRGARVLVIEKAPLLGGTLDRSTGQIAGAGTVFQKSKGIVDTPDAHYEDIMRINEHSSDPALCRLLVDNAADTINWLAENGFQVLPQHPVLGGGHEDFTTPRYLWGKDGGKTILAAMEPPFQRAVQCGRVTVFTSTAAVDLIKRPDGAISGIVTEDDQGKRTDFRARSVVLASGGCAANPTMYQELHGSPLWTDMAYPFSQGDGLMLGLAAGGEIRGGEKYTGLFSILLEDKTVPSASQGFLRTYGTPEKPIHEIYVNSRGERFVREDHPSIDHREKAACRQPGQRFWAIFDDAIFASGPLIVPSFSRDKLAASFNKHPMLTKAVTLSELGVRAGMDPARLQATAAAYNAALHSGGPDPLGRVVRPLPILKPPFYAVRAQTWSIVSFAGLNVDTRMRVLREDGRPVPNLYAAGEIIGAGATMGNAYTNGMMVTPALTFGRLLGSRILPVGKI